jgi:hypothetical protein
VQEFDDFVNLIFKNTTKDTSGEVSFLEACFGTWPRPVIDAGLFQTNFSINLIILGS